MPSRVQRLLQLALAVHAVVTLASLAVAAAPDFGGNVWVLDPSMPPSLIQAIVDLVAAVMVNNHFGAERYALLFKPGTYAVDVPVGFFTQVLGLGALPDDVLFTGSVHSDPYRPNNDGTQNFWRGIENFAVAPPSNDMQWVVSQACPFRRMHVKGNVVLHKNGGWVSGGWIADSRVDYDVQSGSQQQWISRNAHFGSWTGAQWNMVFVGVDSGLPGGTWPTTANTIVRTAPVTREKPFLTIDAAGSYSVFVPSLRRESTGTTWAPGRQSPGVSISIDRFYIAKADVDSAATINFFLSLGLNILLTPGIYDLSEPIVVNNPNTVVLGIGFATLRPISGTAALVTADVDGIVIAGVLIDAGPVNSPVLLQVGTPGSSADHAANPTSLHDIFVRVGGTGNAQADVGIEINSHDVIGDHFWVWRADHGAGAGWTSNPSKNGVVVNGNRVTIYGLFVEHFEQFQTIWRGDAGRTYFYQSEIPYDPPNQAAFSSAPSVNGWASYKVADTVSTHEAWGMGIYSVFTYPGVSVSRAIEAPVKSTVQFHHMVTVNLSPLGAIENVINNVGGSTAPGVAVNTPRVNDYPSTTRSASTALAQSQSSESFPLARQLAHVLSVFVVMVASAWW